VVDALMKAFDQPLFDWERPRVMVDEDGRTCADGLIAGRTASDMPGLDNAELRSWQNFLEATLRLSAALNGSLVDRDHLTLIDVRLLNMLNTSPTGSARMGDLAEALLSSRSRITRVIGRLERRGLVRRAASPEDGRGVLATITDDGRTAVAQAMITYGQGVRTHFLDQLSRPQMVATGENCRRISAALQLATPLTRSGRRPKRTTTVEPREQNAVQE